MNNFLRRWKAAFSFWKTFPVVSLPPDYWTDADSQAWSKFLLSDTGAKLRHLRWNRVYLCAQQAISEQGDSTYKCGVAFGVRAMVAEEDALLKVELPQPEIHEQDAAFKEREPMINNPQSYWPQYNLYFKKKYGISVMAADRDVLVKKPDGTVERIENPITTVELFDAIERIGKSTL